MINCYVNDSHNRQPIERKNLNLLWRETHTAGLGIMIGRCSLDSQHEGFSIIMRMLAILPIDTNGKND